MMIELLKVKNAKLRKLIVMRYKAMNKQFFDNLATKISATLPPIPAGVKSEMEQSIRSILQKTFDKLDLVTREDFEIQSSVLQKTRLKLEVLEQKLAELEDKLNIS